MTAKWTAQRCSDAAVSFYAWNNTRHRIARPGRLPLRARDCSCVNRHSSPFLVTCPRAFQGYTKYVEFIHGIRFWNFRFADRRQLALADKGGFLGRVSSVNCRKQQMPCNSHTMGPYGKALDFRQISHNQITLPLRKPVRQTPNRICNAAVSSSGFQAFAALCPD